MTPGTGRSSGQSIHTRNQSRTGAGEKSAVSISHLPPHLEAAQALPDALWRQGTEPLPGVVRPPGKTSSGAAQTEPGVRRPEPPPSRPARTERAEKKGGVPARSMEAPTPRAGKGSKGSRRAEGGWRGGKTSCAVAVSPGRGGSHDTMRKCWDALSAGAPRAAPRASGSRRR